MGPAHPTKDKDALLKARKEFCDRALLLMDETTTRSAERMTEFAQKLRQLDEAARAEFVIRHYTPMMPTRVLEPFHRPGWVDAEKVRFDGLGDPVASDLLYQDDRDLHRAAAAGSARTPGRCRGGQRPDLRRPERSATRALVAKGEANRWKRRRRAASRSRCWLADSTARIGHSSVASGFMGSGVLMAYGVNQIEQYGGVAAFRVSRPLADGDTLAVGFWR